MEPWGANWREYCDVVDRTGWYPGPWDGEPDKVQWIDPATGLDCLIKRNHWGILCGYVGVAAGHPCFGQQYDAVEEITYYLDVHGGLTYSGPCEEGDEARGICHVAAHGRPEHVWWFGFDTGHAFDLMPGLRVREYRRVYRDLGYVRGEVESLARQLAALEPPPAEVLPVRGIRLL